MAIVFVDIIVCAGQKCFWSNAEGVKASVNYVRYMVKIQH